MDVAVESDFTGWPEKKNITVLPRASPSGPFVLNTEVDSQSGSLKLGRTSHLIGPLDSDRKIPTGFRLHCPNTFSSFPDGRRSVSQKKY